MARRALLLQLDGKTPNLALMRLSSHLKSAGVEAHFRPAGNTSAVERGLFDVPYDAVYASAIFERTRPLCCRLLEVYPRAVVGGSGWDESATLEKIGVPADVRPDYSLYPDYPHSLGYLQRGCRLSCGFCKVPAMEGRARGVATVADLWRGEPHARNLLLLDNDFFGNPEWSNRVAEMNAGRFKVCFNQGVNVRVLSDEQAAAIASTDYRDDQFSIRRLYTAWDNADDEGPLFRGLERLTRHGVRPDHLLVYMLVGFWHGPKLAENDFRRRQRLREFGARPYPMPFVRTRELVGFQRWVVGAYDKRIAWGAWERAGYEPRNLETDTGQSLPGID